MPELIALLHSFVGLAAVLVGWNGYLHVENNLGGEEAVKLVGEKMLGIHSGRGDSSVSSSVPLAFTPGSVWPTLSLSARTKSAPLVCPPELPRHRCARRVRRADRVVRHRAAQQRMGIRARRLPHRQHWRLERPTAAPIRELIRPTALGWPAGRLRLSCPPATFTSSPPPSVGSSSCHHPHHAKVTDPVGLHLRDRRKRWPFSLSR